MKIILIILISCMFLSASCQMNKTASNSPANTNTNANTTAAANQNTATSNISVDEEYFTDPVDPINDPKIRGIGVDSQIGIVDTKDGAEPCLRIHNGDLAVGSEVLIVIAPYKESQKAVKSVIDTKVNKSCTSRNAVAGESHPERNSYYILKIVDEEIQNSDVTVAFGIAGITKPVAITNGMVNIDVDNNGKSEFFRECASMEGLHLTAWTGKPLQGKRVWHRYYYLQYDTESDCKKKDYEGTDDE